MNPAPDLLAQRLAQARVNDPLEFGAYSQSSGDDRKEPIQWRLLDRSDRSVLLLSDRILDCRRYHHTFAETTWRGCDLRAWLNGEFCAAAFTDEDRTLLEPAACTDNGNGAPDTADSVFLLSVKEVRTLTGPGNGAHGVRPAIRLRSPTA